MDWRHIALGIIAETGEMLAELPWRPWKVADQRVPTAEELERALPELADLIATTLRLGLHLGYTPEEMAEAVEAHLGCKRERMDSGRDVRLGLTP
jgi:hypothetical protein